MCLYQQYSPGSSSSEIDNGFISPNQQEAIQHKGNVNEIGIKGIVRENKT